MNKIIGDNDLINRINTARPGDPVVYVNMDFLESLPEAFEPRAVEVRFKKEESFTNVGSAKAPSWYPGTRLMYDIGEARGISCDDVNGLVPYYTEVDISRMEMSPAPCIMRKHTGYQSTKSGRVQQEDGSFRSIVRDHIEDAWIECTGLWDKEELASEGYTKTVKDKWDREGYESEWNGKKEFHEYKYNNKYKRRVHFNDLLDKAMGKADTKAKTKVIRELACLKTGYTDEDLKEGRFIFAKIVKSASQVKMESAARVSALSHGIEDKSASSSLFSGSDRTPPAATDPEPRNVTPAPAEPEQRNVTPEPEPEPTPATLATEAATGEVIDQREELIRVIGIYKQNALIPSDIAETADKIVTWLSATKTAEQDKVFWPKALSILADIEKSVPEAMRVSQRMKR